MKNRRGQALVEFILIIPILMFIILSIIDVGNIITSKFQLENQISTIMDMYENNLTGDIDKFVNDNKLSISYNSNDKYTTILVSKKVNIITPGLNNILGKKMKIETKRTVYNE